MTTKNEYTKGKWEVTKWASHKDVHISINEGSYYRFIANCGNPKADTLPTNPNAKSDASLICALVNAAQEIGEPMKVAENLKPTIEMLKTIKAGLIIYQGEWACVDQTQSPDWTQPIKKMVDSIEFVLSAIEKE